MFRSGLSEGLQNAENTGCMTIVPTTKEEEPSRAQSLSSGDWLEGLGKGRFRKASLMWCPSCRSQHYK